MSLIFNHTRYGAYPMEQVGTWQQFPTNPDYNNLAKYGAFGALADFPSGYGFDGYQGAGKSGNIGCMEFSYITASASGSMGINIEGSTSISIDNNEPAMGLIVSGIGSTTLEVTSTANAIATLNGVASTTFTISLNHLAMYVDADGYASASLGVVGNAYGALSAVGYMSGDTIDDATLTPASIWSYDLRTLSVDIATKGDVYASKFM